MRLAISSGNIDLYLMKLVVRPPPISYVEGLVTEKTNKTTNCLLTWRVGASIEALGFK
jgi:hypothetical protein